MSKINIAIVNSSSFGKNFAEHVTRLEKFANLTRVNVAQDAPDDLLYSHLKDVDGIIASVTPIFRSGLLRRLPKLVLLARHGIGCNNVDLTAATEHGIMVSRVEGIVEREAVAEHMVALLLGAGRHLQAGYIAVKNSQWEARGKMLGIEIKNKRVGLIGIGNIGSRVAEILKLGFGADVVAVDPFVSPDEIRKRNATPVSLDEAIKTCDVISFHCPLTDLTQRMFGTAQFSAMKRGAILINTCRGELIVEEALLQALKNGHIRMYGTDVVEGEPVGGDHPLLSHANVLVVPHLGGYTDESLEGMGETMVHDMEQVFVRGELPGVLANQDVLKGAYRKWVRS